jgi:predicted alpha-1,2-mannosidase
MILPLAYVTPASAAEAALVADPAALVKPTIGTAAYGNTFPGPSVPFGMLQWGPDSSPRYGGGYGYEATAVSGFGLNRMSGPGCPAYGDVPFLPVAGAVPADKNAATVGLNHANEAAAAGSYTLTLNNGVRTELTTARRSALGQFGFPAGQAATLLLKAAGGAAVSAASIAATGSTEVTGSVDNGAFCAAGNRYRVHFAAVFDRSFTSAVKWSPPAGVTGDGGIALSFPAGSVVRARVGISYVSVANARLNRDTVAGFNLATMRSTAKAEWNALLSRIQVAGGTAAQQVMFYTALYHALLHPNVFGDVNRQYRGFDGVVRTVPAGQGEQYANFSGWDVYRTQVQLASLLAPEVMSDFVTSMLNGFDQSGRLPKWSVANDESYVMVGDPALPSIASAYAFGARRFDTARALRAMVTQASRPGNARPGNVYLDERGYLPTDGGYGCCEAYGYTSTSLEYNVADFALSAFARSLGDQGVHARFAERAQAWQHLLHPSSGFIQPRLANGAWKAGFDPTRFDYVDWAEGNAWKYTPMVAFNPRGLIRAKGGNAAMVSYLDSHLARLNEIEGPHAWMGNELSFGTPWLYNWAGAPHKTQAAIRRIHNELYDDAPDGLPGNDDLGALSAWYAFSALGIYPAVPGTADLTVTGPVFTRAEIALPGGGTLVLDAPAAANARPYIQSMTLDGAAWDRPYLPPSVLTNGGTVHFGLGSAPDTTWGAAAGAAPPSYGANAAAVADNQGVSSDGAAGQSDYDGWGTGYSAQALATAGVVPGSPVTAGGIAYTWPNVRPGQPDNVVAAGPAADRREPTRCDPPRAARQRRRRPGRRRRRPDRPLWRRHHRHRDRGPVRLDPRRGRRHPAGRQHRGRPDAVPQRLLGAAARLDDVRLLHQRPRRPGPHGRRRDAAVAPGRQDARLRGRLRRPPHQRRHQRRHLRRWRRLRRHRHQLLAPGPRRRRPHPRGDGRPRRRDVPVAGHAAGRPRQHRRRRPDHPGRTGCRGHPGRAARRGRRLGFVRDGHGRLHRRHPAGGHARLHRLDPGERPGAGPVRKHGRGAAAVPQLHDLGRRPRPHTDVRVRRDVPAPGRKDSAVGDPARDHQRRADAHIRRRDGMSGALMGVLWLALWIWIRHPIAHRRLRKRYLAIARHLGIDQETVISVKFSGGDLVTSQLAIVSLWPGPPDVVVDSLTARVGAAGYTVLTRSGAPARRLAFRAPEGQGLPPLDVGIHGPGETIRGTDVVVPSATTGLRLHL